MEDSLEDTLPGMEQLAAKPGRRACHIREDSNIEPIFTHSLSPPQVSRGTHPLSLHPCHGGWDPGS